MSTTFTGNQGVGIKSKIAANVDLLPAFTQISGGLVYYSEGVLELMAYFLRKKMAVLFCCNFFFVSIFFAPRLSRSVAQRDKVILLLIKSGNENEKATFPCTLHTVKILKSAQGIGMSMYIPCTL